MGTYSRLKGNIMKKTIGILGGMGPLATADLFTKLVSLEKAECDNDHIRVFIDSNSAIPDRTAAILHGGEDPLPEMLSALASLEKCGADCIIMPCNTAHRFLPQLSASTDIPFINMIEVTSSECAARFPGKTAAVLATKGTLATGLYSDALKKENIGFIIPDSAGQDDLMYLIYDVVKASKPASEGERVWHGLLERLRKSGADYFILGCTELPLLAGKLPDAGPFIDPTEELAKAAIRFCGGETAS